MALSGGRLFVPVVDLCMSGSAVGYEPLAASTSASAGAASSWRSTPRPAARTGRSTCRRRTSAARASRAASLHLDLRRRVYGVDTEGGHVLWRTKLRGGVNACPALAARTLLVGSGIPLGKGSRLELTAFRPRSGS